MDVFMWIIFAIIIIPMVIMSLVLLSGRGAFLIAGYNTKSKAERAKYDEAALCRFMGKLLLAVCFFMALLFMGMFWQVTWLTTLGVVLMILVPCAAVIYANTGRRFLKENIDDENIDETTSSVFGQGKKAATVTIVIVVLTLIGCGILLVYGAADPTVHVLEDSLEIRAMYGTTVNLSDITNITLLDANMREIGVGTRRNGFAGFGEALKGHFTSGLLFVQADTEPTIRIERNNRPNIYLNFRDSAQTELLYEELYASMLRRN